jgi:N-acetylmuramoyl-L-alanine amidase
MQICIDPGHGGRPGAVYGGIKEKNIVLSISYLLRYDLMLNGFSVVMTRDIDKRISLQERCDCAYASGCDLFISIHADAYKNHNVSGMGCYVSKSASGTSFTTAHFIGQEFKRLFPDRKHRDLKQKNFYVVKHTPMPAVLVETEFLSNAGGRDFLGTPENQLRIATGIRCAVQKLKRYL